MGALCQGLFGSSADTKYTPPPELKDALTKILNRAGEQSNQPYPQYTPETAAEYSNYTPGLVAPMTPNQVMAGQTLAGLRGYTQPYFDAATGMVANAASPLQMQQFNQKSIDQYMNPYLNNVVGSAVANINQTNAQQQQQVLGNAIQKGAFGGDRAGIAQAELARQQGLANNATIANLLGQGYSQAQQQFNTQQGVDLATQLQNRNLLSTNALNLANLGTQGQQAAMQQGQAQYGYGTAEQQQDQANKSTGYQQYMNEQAFPYQQLSYYSGLASGTAPAWGGTTTGYSPTPGVGSGILGGLSVLGGLSNPGAVSSSNPYSAASAGFGALKSIFPFKDGGRANYDRGGVVGYADGGAPTNDSIIQAYNDYQALARSGHADPVVLQAAYDRYLKSTQGAPRPFRDSSTGVVAATPTPKTTADTTKTTTPEGGGGPSRDVSDLTRGEGANDYNALGDQTGLDRFGGSGVRQGLNLGNLGKGLIGGVDQATGAQTGISGAFDALLHGNSAGTLNKVLNANNTVAFGKRADGSDYPNTTSGQTAQEFADQFAGGDINKVKGSIVRGQMEWFLDTPAGNFLHAGALPASQLTGFATGVQQPESNQDIDTSEYTGPTDLGAAKKSSGVVSNAPASNDYFGGLLQRESGGQQFNPNGTVKTGSAGEIGISQIKPSTAEEVAAKHGIAYSLDKLKSDPDYNQMLGDLYFQDQFNRFGTPELALAAYNAGPGATSKSLRTGSPLPASTQDYVSSVMANNPDAAMRPIPGMVPSPPTNPAYSSALSEIQNPPASNEGIGRVGAAILGYGGLERDTSGDRANLYDRPAGPEMPDSSADRADPRGNEGGFHDTDTGPDSSADPRGNEGGFHDTDTGPEGEKRGGRINRHHFADGGYEPFHMQYGMPSESDIEQTAQDYAGSGAGVLGPQIQALAAKGVLPSAKGGRIHAQTGVGISETTPAADFQYGDERDAYGQIPDEARTPAVVASTIGKAIEATPVIGPIVQSNRQAVERAMDVGKTQPIIPKNKNRPDEGGGTLPPAPANKSQMSVNDFDLGQAPAPAEEPRAPTNMVAADTTRKTSDAPQPGFGYIAPPPMDMRQIAALNFGANLLSGQSLATAGQNYASTMLAQQAQQRDTMKAQAESAAQYGSAASSQATAAKTRTIATPDGLAEIYTDSDGHVYYRNVTPEGQPQGQFAQLPSLPGVGGKPIVATETDASYGPIYSGKDIAPTSIGKDQTLEAMGSFYKGKALGSNAPLFQKQFAEMKEGAQAEASVAQNTKTDLGMAIDATVQLGSNKALAPGAGIQLRTTLANYYKTLGDMVGVDMSGTTADNLTSQQVLNKISTLLAQAQKRGLGPEAGFWSNIVKQAFPSENLTKEANNDLIASLVVSNKRAQDRANVYTKYGTYSSQMGADAPQAFEKVNPASIYGKDITALSDILNHVITGPNGKPMNMITALRSGLVPVAEFDKKAKERYGVSNLSRYFQ